MGKTKDKTCSCVAASPARPESSLREEAVLGHYGLAHRITIDELSRKGNECVSQCSDLDPGHQTSLGTVVASEKATSGIDRSRGNTRACGTDTRGWRQYDWSALIPFVDLKHEVVLADDAEVGKAQPRRRLKVIETSVVFEARAPEDGGRRIKAKGPGGLPPATEGLAVLKPKLPIVSGHDITTLPKPPPIGGSGNDAPPTSSTERDTNLQV